MSDPQPDLARWHAVLTGDVVGSSRLKPKARRELPAILKAAGQEFRKAHGREVPFALDVFRGDSWQLLVSDPALALRAAFFVRFSVIAESPPGQRLDTRVAVAVDRIDFVPSNRVSEGDGPAYRASGAALDGLRDPARMALVAGHAPAALSVVIRLMDALVQDWTAAQARAAKARLQGHTQAEIARRWPGGLSQQGVARHLGRAHWAALEAGLDHLEKALKA
jgi:hypothetical protein